MAKKKKALIRQFEEIVEEEAEMVMGLHGAEFGFHDYSGDVQTVFVVESENSICPVEFFMLENLEKRLKQLGERYQIGIIHEEIPTEEDEEDG
jgi:hypothetical protein